MASCLTIVVRKKEKNTPTESQFVKLSRLTIYVLGLGFGDTVIYQIFLCKTKEYLEFSLKGTQTKRYAPSLALICENEFCDQQLPYKTAKNYLVLLGEILV